MKKKQKKKKRGRPRKKKHAGGRPTVITKSVLQKLESVFSIGGSDREACIYADIAMSTLYNYQIAKPEFVERKRDLKEKPILKARQEVVKGLSGNPEFSLKYLERKKKREFGKSLALTGAGGKDLVPEEKKKAIKTRLKDLLK